MGHFSSEKQINDTFKTLHNILHDEFQIIPRLHKLKMDETGFNLQCLEQEYKFYENYLDNYLKRQEKEYKKNRQEDKNPVEYKEHSKIIIEEKTKYIRDCIQEEKLIKQKFKELHDRYKVEVMKSFDSLMTDYYANKKNYLNIKSEAENSKKAYDSIYKKYYAKTQEYSRKQGNPKLVEKLKLDCNNLHSEKKKFETSYISAVRSHNDILHKFYVDDMTEYANRLMLLHLEYCRILTCYIEAIIFYFNTLAGKAASFFRELDLIVGQLKNPDESTIKLLEKLLLNIVKYRPDYVQPMLMQKIDMATGEHKESKYLCNFTVRSIEMQNVVTHSEKSSPAAIGQKNGPLMIEPKQSPGVVLTGHKDGPLMIEPKHSPGVVLTGHKDGPLMIEQKSRPVMRKLSSKKDSSVEQNDTSVVNTKPVELRKLSSKKDSNVEQNDTSVVNTKPAVESPSIQDKIDESHSAPISSVKKVENVEQSDTSVVNTKYTVESPSIQDKIDESHSGPISSVKKVENEDRSIANNPTPLDASTPDSIPLRDKKRGISE